MRNNEGNPVPLTIKGADFASDPAAMNASEAFTFNWLDKIGLTNATPLRLAVQARKDEPPIPDMPDLPRDVAILYSDMLKVRVQAKDDYGVRDLGLNWAFVTDQPVPTGNASTEVKVQTPTAQEKIAEKTFQWSASVYRVPPDSTVEMQGFARDYFPNRERARTPIYRIHVLSEESHAELLRQQLEALLTRGEEVSRLQEKIVANLRDLLQNTNLTLAQRVGQLTQDREDQLQNSRNLDEISTEGQRDVQEAAKNPLISEQQIQQWSRTLQQWQQLAEQQMREAAESIQAARQNEQARAQQQAQNQSQQPQQQNNQSDQENAQQNDQQNGQRD